MKKTVKVHPRERLRRQAAGQDGQFATPQAAALGVTRHMLAAMRRGGEIIRMAAGVWRFTSTPGDPDPAVTAALRCWPSGVISHDSAAGHHSLTRVATPADPHVTVPHGEVHRLPGVNLHWSRCLQPEDILVVGGVSYTSLARTVIDLADADKPWETLAIVDDAIAGGAKRSWIHSRAKALTNGRGGVALVRDATHRDAAAEFRSWLERAGDHVIRAAGLPSPRWNVRVRDARGSIGIVDALWEPWSVIAELEGLRFHTTPAQRRRDATRFNRLLESDYRVRRFTWEDVVSQPVEMAQTLQRVLLAAGADVDPVRIPSRIVIPDRPFQLTGRQGG